MIELLTDEEICQSLGWIKVPADSRKCSVMWAMENGDWVNQPAFNESSQPWFEYVVPWLAKKGTGVLITCTSFNMYSVRVAPNKRLNELFQEELHVAFNVEFKRLVDTI